MPNNMEENYISWFHKADEDDLSAKALLDGKNGSPSTVCFLSQQVAEKYLKGLLVFYDREFLKTHDLIELEELLLLVSPQVKEFEKELDFLNRFYLETRYPGDYPEFTWEEAQKAYQGAARIKVFVLRKTGK